MGYLLDICTGCLPTQGVDPKGLSKAFYLFSTCSYIKCNYWDVIIDNIGSVSASATIH